MGYTLLKQWLQGVWGEAAGAVTPTWTDVQVALLRAPLGADDGDFGDLSVHDGDILLYDCRRLFEPPDGGESDAPMLPDGVPGGSTVMMEGRAQRKLSRDNDEIHLLIQKGVLTEFAINFQFSLTCLWGRSS